MPRPGVRIVHYHYVFDDERDSFARHVRVLTEQFDVVSLSEAVDRLCTGRVGGNELAITFDDGFRNQLENAAPLLAEHGVSACFFLVTELVGANGDVAARICRERLHLPHPVEPLDWDGAAKLLELGHEVGSHTRSHLELTSVDAATLESELRGSRDDLRARLGDVRHLSAPYGDRARFSATISEAARAAGYESCATAIRGRNHSADDVYALHRDHLSARWPLRELEYFLA